MKKVAGDLKKDEHSQRVNGLAVMKHQRFLNSLEAAESAHFLNENQSFLSTRKCSDTLLFRDKAIYYADVPEPIRYKTN
ncbi:hypothetical protein JOC94_001292 [Bacillus thermophilus]|uniref:Uncharacterized protein n=1 Tax=Siminovitchia thermophila TaxID=1245522 RepID=A0ABS2R4J5_9BACI|nr:hypothetical protein [Siminovitchia thermophila]MBM7714320.1 hypothetical protein [Siminovitchia thermophila]ONK22219.1 hypothetical protein BLX87_17505 [Bacillus sp. VT-16-64]